MTSRRGLDAAFAAGVALGLLIVVLSGFVTLREQRVASNDWSGIWAGPRTLVLGGDPYDATTWSVDAQRVQRQTPQTPVYGYPGYVLFALVPFGLMPLEIAAFGWATVGIALAILGVRALLQTYVPGLPAVHTLAGLTLIASQPGIATLHNGQWSFLLVAVVSGAVIALRRGHDRWAGVALALAMLAKPQLFLISVPALLRVALARRRPRVIGAFAFLAVAVVGISLAILPGWLGAWIHVATMRLPLAPQATAVPTAFADLFGPIGLLAGVALMVALAVACVAFDPRSDAAIAVALAVSAVVVPYAWSYDQLLLIVPLVVASGLVARRSPARGIALMCAGSVLLLVLGTVLHGVFGDARASESFNGVVPPLMALLLVLSLWPIRYVSGALRDPAPAPPPPGIPPRNERN